MISTVHGLDPVPRIDEHDGAPQDRPAAQEVVHQKAPALDQILRRLRKAVAGHVDQADLRRLADVEEIEFLRPPRRVRRARQPLAVGQRVQKRAFPDVRTAGERDFGIGRIGQEPELRAPTSGTRPVPQTACGPVRPIPPFPVLIHVRSSPDACRRSAGRISCTATIVAGSSGRCWSPSRAAGRWRTAPSRRPSPTA